MKKCIAKKFTVLGIIGAMTLAGASSVFAADDGAGNYSSTFMTEGKAKAQITEAENKGEVVEKNDNAELITIGNYTYSYSFIKTEEKDIQSEPVYRKNLADETYKTYAADTELLLHDVHINKTFCFEGDIQGDCYRYTVEGTQYLGYLDICCVNPDTIIMSMDTDTISPDDPTAVTYSANNTINIDSINVEFESSDDTIASVVKFDGKAYVTGHKNGSVIITATATTADKKVFTGYLNVNVRQ